MKLCLSNKRQWQPAVNVFLIKIIHSGRFYDIYLSSNKSSFKYYIGNVGVSIADTGWEMWIFLTLTSGELLAVNIHLEEISICTVKSSNTNSKSDSNASKYYAKRFINKAKKCCKAYIRKISQVQKYVK